MGDVVIGATELRKQLVAAEEAQKTAETAVASAQKAFDAEGSDAAGKALLKARDALALKAEHVARARRLLDEAEAREAEAERQRLMARVEEIEMLISGPAVRAIAAPLIAEELALLEGVAQFRARRIARGEELRKLEIELLNTRKSLGEDVGGWAFANATNPLESHLDVDAAIEERARKLEEPLRSLLRELVQPRRQASLFVPPVGR